MSCSSVDIKGYFLGEVSRAEKAVVDDHLRACESCREELDRLKLTDTALRSLVEEDAPQRIAFVSDKVFEPRWYQTIWRSGPAMGFASSALLAGAILAHGFSLRAPAQPAAAVPVVDTAQIEQRIEREVNIRLEAALVKQREETAKLLNAAEARYQEERRLDRAGVEQVAQYLKNKTAQLMVAANRVETPGQ